MSADNNSWIGSAADGDEQTADTSPSSLEDQPAERPVSGWLSPPTSPEPPLAERDDAPSPAAEPVPEPEPVSEVMPDSEPESGDEGELDAEDTHETEPEIGAEEAPDELTGQISALESDEPADEPETAEALTEEEAAAAAAATVPAAPGPMEQPDDALGYPVPEPRGVDMGPDGRSRWWVWALAVLAVLAIAGAVGYVWWYRTARPIAVPDITGKQPAEATQLLNDLSLRLGAVSETPTSSAPAGIIVSQKPKQGTTLSPGGSVAFVVAAPPDQANVPDVVGRTQESAEAALVSARLLPWIVESFSATTGADTVVGQVPYPGTELPPGTPVVLVVSLGPAPSTTIVPRVTGLSEEEATELLSVNDLNVVVYASNDASIPAGDIISQSPLARTSAPPNSVVQVLVSKGRGTVSTTVPNVVGETKKSAESKLKASGLKSISRGEPSATVAKGRVISQMPPSGRKVAPGTSVGVLVSTGTVADVAVPALDSGASTNVTETISAAGFKPVVLTIAAGGKSPGVVFAQFPQPGTMLPRGFPVVALVASEP